jgi:hypothetical protein
MTDAFAECNGEGPALAVFSWWTEFRVQQKICCDADDDESHEEHRHPIGHFPLRPSFARDRTVKRKATGQNAGYSRRRWQAGLIFGDLIFSASPQALRAFCLWSEVEAPTVHRGDASTLLVRASISLNG